MRQADAGGLPRGAALPALLLLAAAAALAPGAHAAPTPAVPADAYLNADGLPLLMPTNRTTDKRRWYYELPRNPVGTLVMLHRCGRNAEDFWPPSVACPQCIGLPEGVSIAKQALARGYALLAISSFDRSVGSGARCWSWRTDAVPVRTIVRDFRQEFGLERLPLFFTGCSSGGSLALRLPNLMRIDGIMSVAIGLEQDVFPLNSPELEHPYPPTVLVHFPRDASTDAKVQGMLKAMDAKRVPGVEARADEARIGPEFFSRRAPMISPALSRQLHAGLRDVQVLDAQGFLVDDWEVEGQPAPWDVLLAERLPGMLAATAAQQLALKNGSTLAKAQRALGVAGDDLLSIQARCEVSAEAQAGADADAAAEDANPNFSDSDGVAPSSGGDDPYLSPKLLAEHIKEEIGVAWGVHTNLGDYTSAALAWLERCGRANFTALVDQLLPGAPASLSPVRWVPAAETLKPWNACSSRS